MKNIFFRRKDFENDKNEQSKELKSFVTMFSTEQIPQTNTIKEDVATSPEATETQNVITIQSESTMEQEKQSLAVELVGKLVSLFAPAKAEAEQEPEVVVEEAPVEEVVEAPEVVTEEAEQIEEVAPEVVVEAVEEPVQEEVEVEAVEEKNENPEAQAVAESPIASVVVPELSQVSELQAQIAQLTAQLAVKEDSLVMASYIVRAEKEFSHLSGTSEEIATRIKDIEQSTMSAETKELVLNALKAESAQNLADCQEVGTEMGSTSDLSDEEKATLALYTAADALALKENITQQQALYRLSNK